MSGEKFALRWNDFESNICQAFKGLRDEKELCDVTLACEDDHEVNAHRVILASCSPFFAKIFKRYKDKPLLYLKGVSWQHLQSLLNFMYLGQVSVAQDDLASFLSTAEDLQVSGLTQRNSSQTKNQDRTQIDTTGRVFAENEEFPSAEVVKSAVVKPEVFQEENQVYEEDEYEDSDIFNVPGSSEMGWDHDASNKDLFESLTENLMTSVLDSTKGKLWTCRICQKAVKNKPNLQHHIEANHIEEEQNRYNCQFCDTRKSTYKALTKHMYKDHRGIVMQRVNQ